MDMFAGKVGSEGYITGPLRENTEDSLHKATKEGNGR